ncbi:hypothetical protein [Planococcus halocryophilus]|uniref:hypothetical protein n=1 Tax=Planococcus halocryophilus TaxID=1215089 RepID=UPI001F0DAA2F|nr:hypothetical protein [Planococcus halocryophilus]MCH4826294.1 hypothetical protein [Planococcus halocryophilus]
MGSSESNATDITIFVSNIPILISVNSFYHQIRAGNMDEILISLYELKDESVELKWGGEVSHKFKI